MYEQWFSWSIMMIWGIWYSYANPGHQGAYGGPQSAIRSTTDMSVVALSSVGLDPALMERISMLSKPHLS